MSRAAHAAVIHQTPSARSVEDVRELPWMLASLAALAAAANSPAAERVGLPACSRPEPGSVVHEPTDLRSLHGALRVDLRLRGAVDAATGSGRYCYELADGTQSPTLRLQPGDLLTLRLKNEIVALPGSVGSAGSNHSAHATASDASPCSRGVMSATSTNLHFHGLSVSPVCHADEVLKTSIQPTDPPFEYHFRVPRNAAPGLYWYHPHIHGFSSSQVLGGASGALVIEGIERAIPEVAGLPERILVIRDQELLNPQAPPAKSEPVVPRMLIDRDGDSANTGTGFGKPAKDLSVNFVPVPYPDYPPALIRMKTSERELWRVLNASAVTYLNLALLHGRVPQRLGVVAIDGTPLNADSTQAPRVSWVTHIGVPPGARVELIVTAPAGDVPGLFVTRTVDTGQGGENDPNRALASIVATPDAPGPHSRLATPARAPSPPKLPSLASVTPTRVRKLYFSEKLDDPTDPNSASAFYLTVEGQSPAVFDPTAASPNITVRQGDVEDWIIENRSTELHAFHIHQIHFMLMDWSGVPVNEPFLRDTVNVPYFTGRTLSYPSVRLRMDFRDPNVVGTFVYHCHLLEHEDRGMMGTVRVLPAASTASADNGRASCERLRHGTSSKESSDCNRAWLP
jgi:FtsP/CotA-like multicopper oxidase with cupredoxin domain